ncbi:unnamed protein product, partial [marine sediment metagenome]
GRDGFGFGFKIFPGGGFISDWGRRWKKKGLKFRL